MAQGLEREVVVPAGPAALEGALALPDGAAAVVVFAHGSGSGRHSPRNQFVAAALREAGLGTLLMDLLTVAEERADMRTGHLRFDIGLLAERVVAAIDWLGAEEPTAGMPVGGFGASTGAAAALDAAAARPERVAAVVSRGGRPDLAGSLELVRAPTLLIVGGRDTEVIAMNEDAARRMRVPTEMEIVPGAGHLFEEPGALERVAELAGGWFSRHLGGEA